MFCGKYRDTSTRSKPQAAWYHGHCAMIHFVAPLFPQVRCLLNLREPSTWPAAQSMPELFPVNAKQSRPWGCDAKVWSAWYLSSLFPKMAVALAERPREPLCWGSEQPGPPLISDPRRDCLWSSLRGMETCNVSCCACGKRPGMANSSLALRKQAPQQACKIP